MLQCRNEIPIILPCMCYVFVGPSPALALSYPPPRDCRASVECMLCCMDGVQLGGRGGKVFGLKGRAKQIQLGWRAWTDSARSIGRVQSQLEKQDRDRLTS